MADMTKKLKWTVRLGKPEWERHTYERDENDNIRLLGSVRRGLQVGALGVTHEGKYLQVVGDHIVELNTSQIAGAIAVASIQAGRTAHHFTKPKASPVVTVKKRRIPVMA
jgi:hypothetical protein